MQNKSHKYYVDDRCFEGVLVLPDDLSGCSSVLLAPDWMGVGTHAIQMAERMARWGHLVLVADMYGQGRRPTGHDEAAALAQPLKADIPEMRRLAGAGLAALTEEASRLKADAAAPAAIGFCFGGQNVLELGRAGASLSAIVSVHGDLSASGTPGRIDAPVLILHGSADPVSPLEQRLAFEKEMAEGGTRWSMMLFGGAVHSFTDPHAAMPGVAQFDADADRWSDLLMRQFLDESRKHA